MPRTLVVQRGHVPRTTGATGGSTPDGRLTEQQFGIAASEAIVDRFGAIASHFTVELIDADEPIGAYRGDAFVAIHCDSSTASSARGASVGYRSPEGAAFSRLWKAAYHQRGWAGGWRADNYTAALAGYYGTGRSVSVSNRVAFIAESGFLTNGDDAELLDPPDGPARFAAAVLDAVVGYFGITTDQHDLPEEIGEMAPRSIIIKGDEKGDGWVLTGDGDVLPLGGRIGASVERQKIHRDLLVFLGLAVVGKDGKAIKMAQDQVDVLPRRHTAPAR